MPAFVLDASLAAAWCFPDERTEYSNGVLHAVSNSLEAITPRLWAYEVRDSVLMGSRRGRITKEHALDFLVSLGALHISLTEPVSYDRLFNLADEYRLTIYDAAYLDLAMREALPLASLDEELRKAALKSGVLLFEHRKQISEY